MSKKLDDVCLFLWSFVIAISYTAIVQQVPYWCSKLLFTLITVRRRFHYFYSNILPKALAEY
ncbi:hypothetical protein DFP78_104374 [Photobacterium lutimaris]|nr:hypothetical protein DFP78_104374 [Photobacterium lutimaris]